jgi:hypothetical protein
MSAPIVLFLLMGLFDFANLELHQSQLTSASRDGARVGIVHWQTAETGSYSGGACPTAGGSTSSSYSSICAAVLQRLAGSTVSSIDVQCLDSTLSPKAGTGVCSPTSVAHGSDFLQVTVSYSFKPVTVVGMTFLGASRTYTSSSQVVIP